eukprot:g1493.t1
MTGSINCIRLSPGGGQFAVGGDKGEVMIWKRNTDSDYTRPWRAASILRCVCFSNCSLIVRRGHVDDVFDISWSSDGTCLATASLEGVIIIWDALREKAKVRLCEHHHYVQGISWDPFNQYLVSQGGDRRCKIYSLSSMDSVQPASKTAANWKVSRTLFKLKNEVDGTKNFMFHDDSLTSFFRRLDWSPDGSFLVIPSGLWKQNEESEGTHVAYIYSRRNWSSPIACLPAPSEPFIIIRFCPVFFRKSSTEVKETGVFELPYNVVFACATLHSLLIYRTNELAPIALFSGLHYSEITDITWAPDGQYLTVSSTDGYCSIVHFNKGDLGVQLETPLTLGEDCTDWFRALEEVKKAQDPIIAKKRVNPQKVKDCVNQETQVTTQQKQSKRRIVPIAISSEEVKQNLLIKCTVTESKKRPNVEALVSSKPSKELCSDLQQFIGDSSNPSINESGRDQQERSFADFLTSTQTYASRRFQ